MTMRVILTGSLIMEVTIVSKEVIKVYDRLCADCKEDCKQTCEVVYCPNYVSLRSKKGDVKK